MYQKFGGRTINITSWIPTVLGYFLLTRIQTDMSDWFMVLCLILIGFGAGAITTSGSNMIINIVSKRYQGMISSFISLLRFLPITMGIVVFNIVFMQSIPSVVVQNGGTMEAMAGINIQDLIGGFNQAFFFALLISIIILVFALTAHQEIHPDYQSRKDE